MPTRRIRRQELARRAVYICIRDSYVFRSATGELFSMPIAWGFDISSYPSYVRYSSICSRRRQWYLWSAWTKKPLCELGGKWSHHSFMVQQVDNSSHVVLVHAVLRLQDCAFLRTDNPMGSVCSPP